MHEHLVKGSAMWLFMLKMAVLQTLQTENGIKSWNIYYITIWHMIIMQNHLLWYHIHSCKPITEQTHKQISFSGMDISWQYIHFHSNNIPSSYRKNIWWPHIDLCLQWKQLHKMLSSVILHFLIPHFVPWVYVG